MDHVPSPPSAHEHHGAERLKMERMLLFTDAVFAIIMTLLALDVRLPADADLRTTQSVLDTLRSMSLPFSTYAISFFVVATLWNVHLRRYRFLVAVNGAIVGGNMVQLLLVGLVPFATSLLSRRSNAIIVTFYAAVILVNMLAAWFTWKIAARNPRLVSPELTRAIRIEGDWRAVAVIAVFGLSIPIAWWWSPAAAMWSWTLQIPANHLISRFVRVGVPPTE